MKLSSFFIALGLALLLSIAPSLLPWEKPQLLPNSTAIAAEIPSNNAVETSSNCANIATVVDWTLELHYTPDCLEQNLHLSQLLHRLETIITEKKPDKLTVSNLNYALTDDGIHLQADLLVNISPLLGTIPVSVSQDLSVSIKDGYLYLKAGETDLKSSKLAINSRKGFITEQIDRKFARFNGKRLDEVLAINQLNTLAEPLGISPTAVDFVLQSIENKINVNFDNEGLTLAIRFK